MVSKSIKSPLGTAELDSTSWTPNCSCKIILYHAAPPEYFLLHPFYSVRRYFDPVLINNKKRPQPYIASQFVLTHPYPPESTAMSYFPSSTPHLPEEIFSSILDYLHPGAVWLFCRRVSRTWKEHVDGNIERYIHRYATVVKPLRIPPEEIVTEWNGREYLPVGRRADAIFLEIKATWNQSAFTFFIMLWYKGIEFPRELGKRDMNMDDWQETITFECSEGEMETIGDTFSITRVRNFMFPEFFDPHEKCPMDISRVPGTYTGMFGDYEVKYTIVERGGYCGLTINSITIPVRKLMTFSTPYKFQTLWSTSETMSPFSSFMSAEEEVARNDGSLKQMKPLCQWCFRILYNREIEMSMCETCASEFRRIVELDDPTTVDGRLASKIAVDTQMYSTQYSI